MSEVKTNKISSLASNNDITIDPNGTGDTIFASGNVGIGTTTPAGANGIALTVNATTNPRFRLTSDNTGTGSGDGSGIFLNNSDMYISNEESAPMIFRTSATERMRIDSSGNVLVGKSGLSSTTAGHEFRFGGLAVHTVSGNTVMEIVRTTNTGVLVAFNYVSTVVGSISTNGSSTSYNTSSDYRLKENVTATWDATTRLKQLNPVRFNFIADADTTVDGFLAHEAAVVCPESVTGTKDEVDDDGNPVYQGIDQAKLVPLLVKTIQELEARITALEAE